MINCFNYTLNNIGDFYSPPFRYFNLGDKFIDIKSKEFKKIKNQLIIVGGGALTGLVRLNLLQNTFKENSVVAWGVGGDKRVSNKILKYEENEDHFGNTWDECKVISTRVPYAPFKYVPCASCMHKSFDIFKKIIPTKKIGIYSHWKRPIKINGLDSSVTNQGLNFDGKLNYLSDFEIIITNTYHGLYWATLLGKKVICVPNKSGLFSSKYQPTYLYKNTIINEELISNLKTYPYALEESRSKNIDFYKYLKKNFL